MKKPLKPKDSRAQTPGPQGTGPGNIEVIHHISTFTLHNVS